VAVAGEDYPRSFAEMRAWFDTDWKCRDYLDWLRWPDGFVCPSCGSGAGWRLTDRLARWKCGGCGRKVSATAGTVFDKTRTPLTVWFAAAWRLVGDKVGVSATQIQREMDLGSYQTAWAMLHRFRSVMVRPGRDRLRGDVEVDESYLGAPQTGGFGRGALGKVLVAGAVERDDGRAGRARLAVIPETDVLSLRAFLIANVEPGSRVITDGLLSYRGATGDLYTHDATSVASTGLTAHEVLPAVHLIFSLVKRWLMGTIQGSISPEHVQAYLDEWVFRLTGADHAAAGSCSTPCSVTPSALNRSPITISVRLVAPARRHVQYQELEPHRQASMSAIRFSRGATLPKRPRPATMRKRVLTGVSKWRPQLLKIRRI